MGAAEAPCACQEGVKIPGKMREGASESAAGGWCWLEGKDGLFCFIFRGHRGSVQRAPADVCRECSKGEIAKGQTLHPDSDLYLEVQLDKKTAKSLT